VVGTVIMCVCLASYKRRQRNRHLSGATKPPRLSNAGERDAMADGCGSPTVCLPVKKKKRKNWRNSLRESINWGATTLDWLARGSPNTPGTPDPVMGQSPLHLAVRGGNYETVQDMLVGGSDPNVKEQLLGRTPLHIAAIDDKKDICILLIEHGADPSITDDAGFTPSDYAPKRDRKFRATLSKTKLTMWDSLCINATALCECCTRSFCTADLCSSMGDRIRFTDTTPPPRIFETDSESSYDGDKPRRKTSVVNYVVKMFDSSVYRGQSNSSVLNNASTRGTTGFQHNKKNSKNQSTDFGDPFEYADAMNRQGFDSLTVSPDRGKREISLVPMNKAASSSIKETAEDTNAVEESDLTIVQTVAPRKSRGSRGKFQRQKRHTAEHGKFASRNGKNQVAGGKHRKVQSMWANDLSSGNMSEATSPLAQKRLGDGRRGAYTHQQSSYEVGMTHTRDSMALTPSTPPSPSGGTLLGKESMEQEYGRKSVAL